MIVCICSVKICRDLVEVGMLTRPLVILLRCRRLNFSADFLEILTFIIMRIPASTARSDECSQHHWILNHQQLNDELSCSNTRRVYYVVATNPKRAGLATNVVALQLGFISPRQTYDDFSVLTHANMNTTKKH
jgi:hypothetical protein